MTGRKSAGVSLGLEVIWGTLLGRVRVGQWVHLVIPLLGREVGWGLMMKLAAAKDV